MIHIRKRQISIKFKHGHLFKDSDKLEIVTQTKFKLTI